MLLRTPLMSVALATTLVGCTPADPGASDTTTEHEVESSESPDADTPAVPLYAVIPVGPDSARMLWVPWPGQNLTYSVQRALEGPHPKWADAVAHMEPDSAVVSGLQDGDVVRLVVSDAEGLRIGTSVAVPFSPVSAPPNSLDGHDIVDGRGESWQISDTVVHGMSDAPEIGAILVLPMRRVQTYSLVRQVLSTHPDGEGGWSATTEPARVAAVPGTRVGASFNVSADGIPMSLLTPTTSGTVAYCSQSGWGCIELNPAMVTSEQSNMLWSNGYSGVLNQTWSTQQEQLGMTINAEAEGGVIVEAAYEISRGWTGFPNGMEMAYLQTRPYAQADISATIDTSGGSIPTYERPVLAPISVPIFTATFLTITAEFSVNTVAFLEDQTGAGVAGQWTGEAGLSRTYEVGYSSRRARSGTNGFYGPDLVGQGFDVSVQPAFGDGSQARAWFGWKATGSVVLNATVVGELARADLSATTGLVFSHNGTQAAPCNQPVSIAHADIGLGARLDASLDLKFLDPWDFPIADRVIPILGWGRERVLAAPQNLGRGASTFDFRLLNRDFGTTHDHPGTGPFGFPIDASRDVTSSVGSGGLQTFVDSVSLNSSQHPLSTQLGKYTQVLPSTLSAGSQTFAVWMPDDRPAFPSPETLLRAPGQCVSHTIEVQP
jgi:hypothetical protein